MTIGEALEKARKLEEATGCRVALDYDAIFEAATLWDTLSEKGKRGTKALYEEQTKALDRIYNERT